MSTNSKTSCKVFYCWQSDLPAHTNQNFIQDVLEEVAKNIREDSSIPFEPVIDRDVQNVPGSPEIANTIFSKIEQSQVFICDVSIINPKRKFRPIPNPNVLVELGYALRALGHQRIVMVCNSVFGKREQLPFDFRHRDVEQYYLPEDAVDVAAVRAELVAKLEKRIRTILSLGVVDKEDNNGIRVLGAQTQHAIEDEKPNQASLARKYMKQLVNEIDSLNPDFQNLDSETWEELLVQAIQESEDLVLEFASVVETVAMMKASEAALIIYTGFGEILSRYSPPRGLSSYYEHWYDFYRFIGHELFVTFFSLLIRENQWNLIAELLEHGIYVESNLKEARLVSFDYVSQYVRLLQDYAKRLDRGNAVLWRATLLKEHFTKGKVAELIPFSLFVDADFFLLLKAITLKEVAKCDSEWPAWGALLIEKTPQYLVSATSLKYAQSILVGLNIEDVGTLRMVVDKSIYALKETFRQSVRHFHPLEDFDHNKIGSMP